MKKWILFFVFTVLFGTLSGGVSLADDTTAPAPLAVDSSSPKLEQIIRKQDEILKKLDEIKEELEVVKVRASNR